MTTNGEKFLTRSEFLDKMDNFERKLDRLDRGINGDKDLKVKPVREEIDDLSTRVEAVERIFDRGKWFVVGFGVLNSAQLITWIFSLLGSAP